MPPQLIERTRLLPYHGQVDVQVGDWVTETQSVAHLDYIPASMRRLSIASDLAIDPLDLAKVMQKREGDFVQAGETLATSYLFGERIASVSNIDGYVGLISRRLGNAYLRQPIPLGNSQRAELDIGQSLGVDSSSYTLRVEVGNRVLPGQPLAATRGLKQRILTSPIYGRVASVTEGRVVIEPLQVQPELRAYLQGRVTRVLSEQGIAVQAWATVVNGQYGIGGEQGGTLLIVAEPGETLTAAHVDSGWHGKVVVAGKTADAELLSAAAAAGAAGVVVGHLSFAALMGFLGKPGSPGLTGNEETDMTVISTERFRPTEMRRSTWLALQSLAGRYASINGTTHIRAGVARPEIIVCEQNWPAELPVAQQQSSELKVGDRVRILRQPWRDQVGPILELPTNRQRLVTGSEVQVAVVGLAGQTVLVPLANLGRLGEEVSPCE